MGEFIGVFPVFLEVQTAMVAEFYRVIHVEDGSFDVSNPHEA